VRSEFKEREEKKPLSERDIQSNDKWVFPQPSKSYLEKQSSSSSQ
jgi:hypothetical protein